MRRAAVGVAAALGVMTLSSPACAPGPGRAEETPDQTVDTIGDTVVVWNRRPTRPDTATLEAVTRYGTFDGPDESILGTVFAIAVGPDGAVYVDDAERGVKRFRRDGAFDRVIEPYGQGPGEVRSTRGLAVGAGGTVAALDLGNRRVGVLDPEEGFWSVRFPDGIPHYHEDAIQFHADGSLWVGINPPFDAAGQEPSPRPGYIRIDRDRGAADTLFIPEYLRERCPLRSERSYGVGFWYDQRTPYVPKLTWAAGTDGSLAVGCPAAFELDVLHPDGTVLRIGREWTPLPLAAEVEAFQEKWWRGPPPAFPDTRPAYARIVLSDDGRVWVWPTLPFEKYTPDPEVQERFGLAVAWELGMHGAFDVFDGAGTWIGAVRLPDEVRYSGYPTEEPIVIRGDTIWAVSRDSLDVEYVTRYRVRWGR